MSVCTVKYLTLSGKLAEVTVARSTLQEGGGCLIVGSGQTINLSNIIRDKTDLSVTGLFFDSLSSSEIVTELSSQTILDIQSFQKVIFTLSDHDITLSAEFDLITTIERIKTFFSNSDLHLSDYLFSPKKNCSGLLSEIKRNNLILEGVEIPVVKISVDLTEKEITMNQLPVPICDLFTGINNNEKNIVTMEGIEKIFNTKYLGILCLKISEDSLSMPLPSQEHPQQVGTTTHQDFTPLVGASVEHLQEGYFRPIVGSSVEHLQEGDFPPVVGASVEHLQQGDLPSVVGACVEHLQQGDFSQPVGACVEHHQQGDFSQPVGACVEHFQQGDFSPPVGAYVEHLQQGDFPSKVGASLEHLPQGDFPPIVGGCVEHLQQEDFSPSVGASVEHLQQGDFSPPVGACVEHLQQGNFPAPVGACVEHLQQGDFPPPVKACVEHQQGDFSQLVGASMNQKNQMCTQKEETPQCMPLRSLENPSQACPSVPQPCHPVTRVVPTTLSTPDTCPVIPVLRNVSGTSYFTSNNLAAFPPLTKSLQTKTAVRVERWVKVSKQKPKRPTHNTDHHENYHPARTEVSFCQPNPSAHTGAKGMRPQTKKDSKDRGGSSIPTNSSTTSSRPYSQEFYKVFVQTVCSFLSTDPTFSCKDLRCVKARKRRPATFSTLVSGGKPQKHVSR